jgi:hypothetical protein
VIVEGLAEGWNIVLLQRELHGDAKLMGDVVLILHVLLQGGGEEVHEVGHLLPARICLEHLVIHIQSTPMLLYDGAN